MHSSFQFPIKSFRTPDFFADQTVKFLPGIKIGLLECLVWSKGKTALLYISRKRGIILIALFIK